MKYILENPNLIQRLIVDVKFFIFFQTASFTILCHNANQVKSNKHDQKTQIPQYLQCCLRRNAVHTKFTDMAFFTYVNLGIILGENIGLEKSMNRFLDCLACIKGHV